VRPVEGAEVTLALHEHVLHQPFPCEIVSIGTHVPVVPQRMSEIVKRQVFHFQIVAFGQGETEFGG